MLPGLQCDMHQKYDNWQNQVHSKHRDMYLHALKNVDKFNSENKMFEFVKIINTNTQRYSEISQALL